MTTIHFFDHCDSAASGDRKSHYRAEANCEPCIQKMLVRGLLTESDAKTMRYLTDQQERREWEDEQAAQWATVEGGERAMMEMGLLR